MSERQTQKFPIPSQDERLLLELYKRFPGDFFDTPTELIWRVPTLMQTLAISLQTRNDTSTRISLIRDRISAFVQGWFASKG